MKPKLPLSNLALNLAQKQDASLAQEFLADYKKLVEKYGFDFAAPIQIVKVNPNVNSNNNLDPLNSSDKPAK